MARTESDQPSALARELVATTYAGPGTDVVRVLELFQPAAAAVVVDLSLSERDVPEIAALLHETDAIHVHGVSPATALRCLPPVRADVLVGKRLVLHGAAADGEALKWDGPVERIASEFDEPGPTAANTLPRACGSIPLELDDGSRLAVVALVGEIPASARTQLRLAIEALSLPNLRVETYDEAEVPPHERAARRRATQAAVLGAGGPRFDRDLAECLAMNLPLVVFGEGNRTPGRRGVVFAGGDVERVGACLRSWTSAWAHGGTPGLDGDGQERR